MSCKRLSLKARAEQDYWISFSDIKDVTEGDRLTFLRYDSHGGEVPYENPIYLGKKRHGQIGEVLRDSYFDMQCGWVGGLELVHDYMDRKPFGLRPLREWFGDEAVNRWVKAYNG